MNTSSANIGETDSQLESRIINCLHAKGVPELASIHLDVHDGSVVISGTVSQTSVQRHCYECCSHVAGVIKVINRIEIYQSNKGCHKTGWPTALLVVFASTCL